MNGLESGFSRISIRDYTVPDNGIAGGYTGDNQIILRSMVAFSAIAWYNAVELILLICIRFKRWRGLYFWSLMLTSWAIIIYQVGCSGKMNNIIPQHPIIMALLTNITWIVMVCGESLVLYSRLHILSQNRRLLSCVLWGILINCFCCYLPTTYLDLSANVFHPDQPMYVLGYSIMERLQMTLLTIQEVTISAIYLIEAYKFLNLAYVSDKRSRNVMYELVIVNTLIIAMDIGLLTVAQLEYFAIEVTMKGMIYSIKLKLELGVLSRLVNIVSHGGTGLQRSTTFEASPHDPPFGMPDFCVLPCASTEKKRDSFSTAASLRRKRLISVPWLTNASRTKSDPKSASRRSRSSQRADSFANQEFLTSAAVTEGANDQTIRNFKREIEAELASGGRKNSSTMRSLRRDSPSREDMARLSALQARTEESPFEVVEREEMDWERRLGVLGQLRPAKSREDGLEGLTYPGRITGRDETWAL